MPLRDKKDRVIGTFGVSRDITKRKLAEEALKFRVEFEKLITSISTTFVNLTSSQIDGGITSALQVLGCLPAPTGVFAFCSVKKI